MEDYSKELKELEEERASKLEEAKASYLAIVKDINNRYSQTLGKLKEKHSKEQTKPTNKKGVVPITYLTQSIPEPVNTSKFQLVYGKVKSNQIKIERNGVILL